MAFPNQPMNIADSYTADRNLQRINAAATELVWGLNREATRKYETERQRLTNIGMSVFGDAMKKMSNDIAYATGGYLLDREVQMRQLDVAADVQKRLSDEAVAAGPLISFTPGPNPDQAIQEVAEKSNRVNGKPFGETEGSVEPFGETKGSVESPDSGSVETPKTEQGFEGTQDPTQKDIKVEFLGSAEDGKRGGKLLGSDQPPARGQSAQDNVSAVRNRGASASSGRPSSPRRAPHTNVGTTEIYVNPTTGGFYARTAAGLTVPISEQTYFKMENVRRENAEIHLFNESAAYKDSLAHWVDSLAEEQKLSNQELSGALVDSHAGKGLIDSKFASALKSYAASGGSPEMVLKILNQYGSGNRSNALNSLVRDLADTNASYSRHFSGKADDSRTAVKNIDNEIAGILKDGSIFDLPIGSAQRNKVDELMRHRKNEMMSIEKNNLLSMVYGDLGANKNNVATSLQALMPAGRRAIADLTFMGVGVRGDTAEERRNNINEWINSSPQMASALYKEFQNWHDYFGLGPVDTESKSFLLQEMQREGVDVSKMSNWSQQRNDYLGNEQEDSASAGLANQMMSQDVQMFHDTIKSMTSEGQYGVMELATALAREPEHLQMVESILGAENIEAAEQMVAAQFSGRSLPEPILEALAMKKIGVSPSAKSDNEKSMGRKLMETAISSYPGGSLVNQGLSALEKYGRE